MTLRALVLLLFTVNVTSLNSLESLPDGLTEEQQAHALYLSEVNTLKNGSLDSVLDMLNPSTDCLEPIKYAVDDPIFKGHDIYYKPQFLPEKNLFRPIPDAPISTAEVLGILIPFYVLLSVWYYLRR